MEVYNVGQLKEHNKFNLLTILMMNYDSHNDKSSTKIWNSFTLQTKNINH